MAPAELSVCSEQVFVEDSQLLACSTQTKALTCVYILLLYPIAVSSNSAAAIPSGAVKFHQCAAGGKLS